MSYLNNGQWANDKNERKYRHMLVIPFPVCEYAAINYKDGRRLEKCSNYIERRRLRIKWNRIKEINIEL